MIQQSASTRVADFPSIRIKGRNLDSVIHRFIWAYVCMYVGFRQGTEYK